MEMPETCQKPTEGNVIISTTKSIFLLEENLPYTCKDGYETIHKALEDNSECTVNGWSPRPQCLPIQCEGLLLVNGDVHPREDQYLYNDVVQFSCRTGYVRVGPLSAQCYHFGWSPPPPVCKAPEKASSCQPPSNITNGRIITALQEEYPHGHQVEYECNLKYAMTGSEKIECVDGRWTPLPSCTVEKRTCGPPPFNRNGVSTRRYFHGATVRYECTKSSAVVGNNSAKCLHGQWDIPSCADGCSRPELPENRNSDPLNKRYKNNEVFSYTCDSNQRTTTCLNGNWSPKPDCRGLCPPPPQLPNAIEITEVRNYENGEKTRFTYASCGNPPSIANGGPLNGTQGRYLPGTKVKYRCNEGFDIINTFSTCKNKSWTPGPTCKEKSCGSPPQVFDASLDKRVKKSYASGETIQVAVWCSLFVVKRNRIRPYQEITIDRAHC
ncbi:UNVERIFIED_CONTAM: hypothetical protein K2H54_035478 [Gekko kuhli]